MNPKIEISLNDDIFSWEGNNEDIGASTLMVYFADLLNCHSFSKETIYNAMREWIKNNEDIKENADKIYSMLQ